MSDYLRPGKVMATPVCRTVLLLSRLTGFCSPAAGEESLADSILVCENLQIG